MASSTPRKSVIVTFPEGTPDSVVEDAKQAIKQNGGTITHEYKDLLRKHPRALWTASVPLGQNTPPPLRKTRWLPSTTPFSKYLNAGKYEQ
ncbi:predicted protein [Uncinocarpus reesii 1704]|uniref:Uncharacterized protein n=1 Tax=Uncinocarpus reesii (strain UAMH 1704) TaxID=336963 RepID=C4JPN3_UNCRE|nr:uncharacterized protein UREG_03205 [Uncinocarpus reesii 1704]EEP78359.1 predicted protein [Uncinocarpus reesii 1704]